MMERLINLVNFNSGLIISREKNNKTNGIKQYHLLNYKCLSENGIIKDEQLDTLDLNRDIDEKYLTREKDIVIKLTYPFIPILIDKKHERIVITSNFCKIVCTDKVLPEYLITCLNSKKIVKQLKTEAKNQVISQISIKELGRIMIDVRDIERQKKVARLYECYIKKIMLTKNIIEKEQIVLRNIYS